MHHHSTASTLCTQPATGTNTICNLAGLAHFSLSLPQPTGAEIFFKKPTNFLVKKVIQSLSPWPPVVEISSQEQANHKPWLFVKLATAREILSLMSEGKQKGKKDILQLTLDTHLGIVAVTIPNGLKT